jgi:hypothetical protein
MGLVKKIIAITAAVVLAAAAAFPQTTLTLRGGAGYAGGGDLAAGLSGLMDYYASQYSDLSGKHSFAALGWTAGGEILVHLGPRWGLGLAAGYERRGRETQVTYGFGAVQVAESLAPRVGVIPLLAGLHAFLPLGRAAKLDLQAGLGAYFTRLDWTSSYALSVLGYQGTDDFAFSSRRVGIGPHIGVGLVWPLSSRLDIVLEAGGRFVRVSGFAGDWTESGSGDLWSFSESGTGALYAYDWNSGSGTFRQIAVQSEAPEGTSVSSVREARLDLSGVTATAGIRLRLF